MATLNKTPFASAGPSPHNNVNLIAKNSLGPVPSFAFQGIAPGTTPEINQVNTHQPFGNPKAELGRFASIFKLLHNPPR